MIRAHMATYPLRSGVIEAAVDEIAAQVDRLFLVMNEFKEIPVSIAANPKIEAIIPDQDLKDVGKFYFRPEPDDIVFFVDDDVVYPEKFVRQTLRRARQIGLEDNVFGYHCSIYQNGLPRGANSRRVFRLRQKLAGFHFVDQIGTGAMLALGKNVPPLEYMLGSQKFVDVRYAKWLYENGVRSIAMQRRKGFFQQRPSGNPEDASIYRTFTRKSPAHVLDEIKSFAGKFEQVGEEVGAR